MSTWAKTEIWHRQPVNVTFPGNQKYQGWEERLLAFPAGPRGSGSVVVLARTAAFNIVLGKTQGTLRDATLTRVSGIVLEATNATGIEEARHQLHAGTLEIAPAAEFGLRASDDVGDDTRGLRRSFKTELTYLRSGLRLGDPVLTDTDPRDPYFPFHRGELHLAALLASGVYLGWRWADFLDRAQQALNHYDDGRDVWASRRLRCQHKTWPDTGEPLDLDVVDVEAVMQVATAAQGLWDMPREFRERLGPGLLGAAEIATSWQRERAVVVPRGHARAARGTEGTT